MISNAEKNRVEVSIFGKEYIVIGDKPSDYIMKIAEEVDSKMQEIHQINPNMPQDKIAVMVAINVVDELTRFKEEYQWLLEIIEDEKSSDRIVG